MKTLIVHPDDLNLADVKAKAAELGITAVGDKYIPRGQMVLYDPAGGLVGPPHGPAGRRPWPNR
jgi:hypothetical protein